MTGRGSGRRWTVALLAILSVSGCVGRQGVAADPAAGSGGSSGSSGSVGSAALPSVTVTLTRTTAIPLPRTDISSTVRLVEDYVTGAAWNNGRIPANNRVVVVDDAASRLIGRLTYSESADRSSLSTVQTVQAEGAGNPARFQMTVRSSSTDPDRILDVLHRSGNPRNDYLLTGAAYRSVAPTAWVTVPAKFGNGLGCAIPGRQVLCQVTADLLRNQALDPSMPTNTASVATATGVISSAITLRQLLALDVWRLRNAGASLARKASAAELDQTLIAVRLTYDIRSGLTPGRPVTLSVNGKVTVGGISAAIDLDWDETGSGDAKDLDLPVPTKALYTALNAAQAAQLSALAGRSE